MILLEKLAKLYVDFATNFLPEDRIQNVLKYTHLRNASVLMKRRHQFRSILQTMKMDSSDLNHYTKKIKYDGKSKSFIVDICLQHFFSLRHQIVRRHESCRKSQTADCTES